MLSFNTRDPRSNTARQKGREKGGISAVLCGEGGCQCESSTHLQDRHGVRHVSRLVHTGCGVRCVLLQHDNRCCQQAHVAPATVCVGARVGCHRLFTCNGERRCPDQIQLYITVRIGHGAVSRYRVRELWKQGVGVRCSSDEHHNLL